VNQPVQGDTTRITFNSGQNLGCGMSHYRRFALKDHQIADTWAATVDSPTEWTLLEKLPCESGARKAISDNNLVAVAKPDASLDGLPRAANEKIASDLAHRIGVPVPAVCLWTDKKSKRQYSVSAWAFPQCVSWAGAAHLQKIDENFIEAVRPLISIGWIFHTWIGNTDTHGENVLIDARGSKTEPGIAFIDHAWSLGATWRTENDPMTKAGTVYCGRVSPAPSSLADMASRIRSLNDSDINEIVGRIPSSYLPSDRRRIIIENLLRRREQLAGLFGVL
jgi:hypothetical protein